MAVTCHGTAAFFSALLSRNVILRYDKMQKCIINMHIIAEPCSRKAGAPA